MPFGDSYEARGTARGESRESPYLRMSAGERIIRVLDDDAVSFWQYYLPVTINGAREHRSITVGSGDNAIKRYMSTLDEKHPNFRKVSRKFAINVLDKTMVVRENSQTIYPDDVGDYPGASRGAKPVPNNRIMIMTFGSQLMESMRLLHNRVRNMDTAALMTIQEFDIKIITRGTGRDTVKMAIPSTEFDSHLPLADEVVNGPRYDLRAAYRPMPDEALQRILSGEDFNEVIKSLGWESVKPLW